MGNVHGIDGFRYCPEFLNAATTDRLTTWVGSLDFQHHRARGNTMRRATAMFGFAFVTDGRRLEAAEPCPTILTDIITAVLPICPPGTELNHCIVTKYPPGAGIGWHTDAPCFDDCIVGVSMGSEAELLFRHRGETKVGHVVTVVPRSLYVLSGSARWNFEHSVRPVMTVRYSLTLRRALERRDDPRRSHHIERSTSPTPRKGDETAVN
jgi:alkylated DNA repair protein (DNA oxidative demethylase)